MKNSKMKKSSPRELNSDGWVVNRTLEDLMRLIDKYGDMLEEDTLARPDLGVDWWTAEYIAENIEKAIGKLQEYVDELRQYANSGERKPIEEWQNAFDKSTKKSKMKKYDEWTVSNLFDELEDAVYGWDEGWIDNVMDANYSQAHGNVEDACKYLEEMYDECHVPRIATLCERIFAILGHSEYCASTKKSYTPDYKDFRSMVGSIRNTGNHNKVFKE